MPIIRISDIYCRLATLSLLHSIIGLAHGLYSTRNNAPIDELNIPVTGEQIHVTSHTVTSTLSCGRSREAISTCLVAEVISTLPKAQFVFRLHFTDCGTTSTVTALHPTLLYPLSNLFQSRTCFFWLSPLWDWRPAGHYWFRFVDKVHLDPSYTCFLSFVRRVCWIWLLELLIGSRDPPLQLYSLEFSNNQLVSTSDDTVVWYVSFPATD